MTTTDTATAAATEAKDRLALALDGVSTVPEAVALAAPLKEFFGTVKVGLQLFTATGPAVVEAMRSEGFEIFLDLKLHDIPNTVRGAATEVGKLGVAYATVHASGGLAMMNAAAEGFADGAAQAGEPVPAGLGVTVLTSDTEAPPQAMAIRVAQAHESLGAVVCAAPDLPVVLSIAPDIYTVTPGIRLAGGDTHDQARIATPSTALAGGAGLLVIGRAVTGAADPLEAARLVHGDAMDGLS